MIRSLVLMLLLGVVVPGFSRTILCDWCYGAGFEWWFEIPFGDCTYPRCEGWGCHLTPYGTLLIPAEEFEGEGEAQ